MELALSPGVPRAHSVVRAKDREVAWLEALYREHTDRVYRYAYALVRDPATAEDVCAEAFVRAWQKRHALRDEDRVVAWLLAITRRLAMESIRSMARRRQFETVIGDEDVPLPFSRGNGGDDARLWRCFGRLSPDQQRVLYLRAIEGLPHDEVARILGRSPGAVRAVQFRALARMRRLLEGTDDL